ncbi:sulfatase-like hydrolase/transferase [Bacillus sp. N1-1]|uniref:sulfatase-like hydrolase/transferase n=1 Tax=Bacillus sp. N1-1 TaxID=2682541 RepID=UPI001357C8EF|nr:sulfatase-like hydrolase/transferase [Bacillus sp. N1-1]
MNRQKPLTSLFTKRKPNFLILMVDEELYPSVYEPDEVGAWPKKNLLMQELLLENGFEFKNHYIGSSASSPSEMTLYTGQYPSLHGVTQTSFSAKTQFNHDIDSNHVPTMRDYLQKAGYQAYWKEKCFASVKGIQVANQSTAAATNEESVSDVVYADEVMALLQKLDREETEESKQWVIFSSFLSEQSHGQVMKVFQTLKKTTFYRNTIVLFLLIEGQGLGADGKRNEKRNNVFEKSIHVPLIVHSPALFNGKKSTTMLTSHVDVLPTMLGLAGIDEEEIQTLLSFDYTEVRPLVGRDLTPLLSGKKRFYRANEPLYFMTNDDGRRGLNGAPEESEELVVQPNHIEAVMTTLHTGDEDQKEVWKYARYYDDPQFWRIPGVSDVTVTQSNSVPSEVEEPLSRWVTTTKTTPAPDEFELYNVTRDPLEEKNLAHPNFETPESKENQKVLSLILEEQRRQKRLSPRRSGAGNVAM